MKKAEEYLKQLFQEPYNLEEGSIEYDFLQLIKEVQRDAIQETCRVCADNAATIHNEDFLNELSPVLKSNDLIYKPSILKVAEKLIKELE